MWPFAVYFSTAILALGALAATFVEDRLVAAAIVVVATAAAAFVRPELAVLGSALAAVVVA